MTVIAVVTPAYAGGHACYEEEVLKKLFIIFIISLFFIECQKYGSINKGQFLYFEGLNNKEALLSRIIINKAGKENIVPLERVFTNTKIHLPAGRYMLSNECSSYEFTQEENTSKRIFLSHLQLDLLGDVQAKDELQDDNQVVQSLCYNVLNQREYSYKNKVQFDILPGKNNLFISGKNLDFNIKPDSFENLSLSLIPLTLQSSAVDTESPHFFVISHNKEQNEQKKVVISAPINGKMWLFPGQYLVEVNGTKQLIDLQTKIVHKIQLGMLKVIAPKNFPFEKRMELGGQPISAFIDDKVLIRLNTSYPVFAGKYIVNLEGSELDKEVEVEENKMTVVKTLGAQIDAPPCTSKTASCITPSRITIHENKQPFILMVIPVGQPFLVFEGNNYQYGVEGIKGIFKSLPTSTDSVKSETLGLVNMKWEVRYTTSNSSTDFVRFESKSSNLYGKSVDLSFFKPTEVYLPEGDYWLTYYVGDSITQNVPKTRVEVNLYNGSIKDLTIPLFVHGIKNIPKDSSVSSASSDTTESSVLVPIKK